MFAALVVTFGFGLLTLSPASAVGPGQLCGGLVGIQCDRGLTCEMPTGVCGVPHPVGACAPTPRACPRSYRPVCGCNGRTYANDCVRQRARVAKARDGRC
jgi:hypothetical protein